MLKVSTTLQPHTNTTRLLYTWVYGKSTILFHSVWRIRGQLLISASFVSDLFLSRGHKFNRDDGLVRLAELSGQVFSGRARMC